MTPGRRIRIAGFADTRARMTEIGIAMLPDFFITYESVNRSMPRERVIAKMENVLNALRESVSGGISGNNSTPSGMVAGGAALLRDFGNTGQTLLGAGFSQVVRNSMAVAEHNACMGRVVAAPTAGSAGVLPGALLTVGDLHGVTHDALINALFVAGGIGEIIAIRASLSGSTHGCQAENGAASAMTAAGIASLFTDDVGTLESAAAFALKNLLGLVCDPVGGLVELPCVKRNVAAAVNAVACAEMALAGIRTVIPLDEVIDAMASVGNSLPCSLRETSLGGLAATETGRRIAASLRRREKTDFTTETQRHGE